jgi:hypothetical protein
MASVFISSQVAQFAKFAVGPSFFISEKIKGEVGSMTSRFSLYLLPQALASALYPLP